MILHTLIDYDILRLIWWGLLGVLLIGFALTDGFDLGVGALLPFVAKTDTERRIAINTVGPVWEGNQVWFILGGGAIFAAWPPLYAVSFSGFYLAMFVVLAALIVRPVAFKFRSKRDDVRWRTSWDWALFASGAIPALLFGVAVGNVIQGVPFHFTDDLHTIYEGAWYAKFIGLLDPFSLLAGIVSLSMLVMHGGAWLTLKAEGKVRDPASWVQWPRWSPWPPTRWQASGWRWASRASALLAITSPPVRPIRCISKWRKQPVGCRPTLIARGSRSRRSWASQARC